MLVFVCVAANHMGLIQAVEEVIGKPIPIVSCPKCFTFWAVLSVRLFNWCGVLESFFVAFLASYAAIWLELLMGIIDLTYNKVYEKIYPNSEDDAASSKTFNTEDAVSQL